MSTLITQGTNLDRGVLHEHVGARLGSRVHAETLRPRKTANTRPTNRGIYDDRTLVPTLCHSRNLW